MKWLIALVGYALTGAFALLLIGVVSIDKSRWTPVEVVAAFALGWAIWMAGAWLLRVARR